MSNPKVGLVMIVRDEEANIVRALQSARPFISTWVIVDTGSTDRTMDLIRETYSDIPGVLLQRPWVNFGHNRSEALAACMGTMDWAIMMDADDTLEGVPPPQDLWKRSDIDAFVVQIHHLNILHRRVQIFNIKSMWIYRGAVHEHPICAKKDPIIVALPESITMKTRCEGFRSRNPNKYMDDAKLLLEDYHQDPSYLRTVFYLAQSYRDGGDRVNAMKYYKEYIASPHKKWNQEVYISMMNIIHLTDDKEEALKYAWETLEVCPHRLEAIYGLLQKWRSNEYPPTRQIYALAKHIKARVPGNNDLFTVVDVYRWGIDFETAILACVMNDFYTAQKLFGKVIMMAPEEIANACAQQLQDIGKRLQEQKPAQ
jgi:glycosyltransferase involved in cell wall biosynthesis